MRLGHTDRRLRPFARRALMTFWPLRVAIRALKPCVRFRLMTLGWKVRFMEWDRSTRKGAGF
jgi:hypothetical protein